MAEEDKKRTPAFRGLVIEISEDGKVNIKNQGINNCEAFGALSMIYERLRKQYDLD